MKLEENMLGIFLKKSYIINLKNHKNTLILISTTTTNLHV